MNKQNVLVIGSINMDLVVRSARIPGPGETIIGGEFITAPGGKGANQAVAAARLGARCRLIGKVGDDDFGRRLRHDLQQAGVDTDAIQSVSTKPTGVALILVDRAGENAISVASGANTDVTPDALERHRDLIAAADVCLLQLELPVSTVIRTIELCKEHGVCSVLDTAPAPSPPIPTELFRADLVTPNLDEARRLTALDMDPDRPDSVRAGADHLHRAGAERVVIKLGSAGAYWLDGEQDGFEPAVPISSVDTTAAGDAFTATLALAVARGASLASATRYANAAGAVACLTLGAQPSMPTKAQITQLLQSG